MDEEDKKVLPVRVVLGIFILCFCIAMAAVIVLAVVFANEMKREDEEIISTTESPKIDHCPDNTIDVSVVGAGLSGVYSAYKLSQEHNQTINIYKANSRIGGRLYSIPVPGISDFKADVGAMRFKKGRHPRLFKLIQELELAIQPFSTPKDENTLRYLRGELLSLADVESGKVPYGMTEEENDHAADDSLYGYWSSILLTNESKVEENPWKRVCTDGNFAYEKGILNAFLEVGTLEAITYMTDKSGFQSVTGNNWNYAEWSELVSNWGSSEEYYTLKEGFSVIVDTMMESLLQDTRNQLFKSHELRKVSHNGELFVLQFADKNAHKMVDVCAKKVVLAMSAESLKRITFEDRAINQELTKLLPSVNQSPACKIFLVYKEAWWKTMGNGAAFDEMRANGTDVELIITDLPVGIIMHIGTDSSTGKAMLGLYNDWWRNTHFWAPYMTSGERHSSAVDSEFLSTTKLVDQINVQLAQVFNISVDKMPQPEVTVPHCWYTDPYWTAWHDKSAGFNFSQVIEDILKPVAEKDLFIVGEAFSNHQVETEGAMETAQNMLTKHFGIMI